MVKEGKGDKTVTFSKSDGTAISFKARVTRSKQQTDNYLRHARKSGRMTVSAGAKKPKKTGGNFVRKPPTFISKKKPRRRRATTEVVEVKKKYTTVAGRETLRNGPNPRRKTSSR